MKKLLRICAGSVALFAGVVLIVACVVHVGRGEFTWLSTALFGLCTLFVGYGLVSGERLRDILDNFIATLIK